jgi:hypothetical protein
MEHEDDSCGRDSLETKKCHASERSAKPPQMLMPMRNRGICNLKGPSTSAYDIGANGADISSVNRSVEQCPTKKTRLPIVPRPCDVLLGREKGRRHWPGNVRMADIADQYRSQYFSQTSLSNKTRVIRDIVSAIQSCDGGVRFLKELPGHSGWVEADETVAHARVSQNLRFRHRSDREQKSNHVPRGWNRQPAQPQQPLNRPQHVPALNNTLLNVHKHSASLFDLTPNAVAGTAIAAYPPDSSDWTSFPSPGAASISLSASPAVQPPVLRAHTEKHKLVTIQLDCCGIPAGLWSSKDQHQVQRRLQQSLVVKRLPDPTRDLSWPFGQLQPTLWEEIPVAPRGDETDSVKRFAIALTGTNTEYSEEFISSLDHLFDDED